MATTFRNQSAFAAGIAVALAAAFAVPASANKTVPAPAAAETKDNAKVCIAAATGSAGGDVTGSIMKRKICRTKAKWMADGVTFDENGAPVSARN